MAANPFTPQGTLNRLRASLVWTSFPSLNITPSFMGKEMLRVSFGGGAATRINTATGQVISPEPYIPVTVRAAMLKSQSLAAAYKAQMELDSVLGDMTVRPDATTLPPYQFVNCSMQDPDALDFNGESAAWTLTFNGTYYINNNYWG